MIGLFGVIAAGGRRADPFSAHPDGRCTSCILAASFAISRSDRAHQTSTRNELIWAGRCVVLAARWRHPLPRLHVARPDESETSGLLDGRVQQPRRRRTILWGLGVSAMTEPAGPREADRPLPARGEDDKASKRGRPDPDRAPGDVGRPADPAGDGRGASSTTCPAQGKPIDATSASHHDPDWWLKKLIEREQIIGVLPPGPARCARRTPSSTADARRAHTAESEVRRERRGLQRSRSCAARYRAGSTAPPLITHAPRRRRRGPAWRERRRRRRRRAQRTAAAGRAGGVDAPSRRWSRRGSGSFRAAPLCRVVTPVCASSTAFNR